MKERSQLLGDQSKMVPLIELINEAYRNIKGKLPYDAIQDFITDDAKSTEFIRSILQDDEFETPDEGNELFDFAKTRARHSAITFLIGLVLLKYGNFEKMISNSSYAHKADLHNSAIQLWMITALYHDYGYFLRDIQKEDVDFRTGVKYYLLDDSYSDDQLESLQKYSLHHKDAFAFTYGEIEEYDRCSRQFRWRKNVKEKVDHGILGGIRIFNRLIKRAKGGIITESDLIMIKASCLTIAQHNIFKSESVESDCDYGDALRKLHSTSTFAINADTPLLLLLSLVDTFECVKKLSKGENETSYLESISVLSSISLSVTEQELAIDFSQLIKRIEDKKSEELENKYKKYKENLLGLNQWTSLDVEETENETFRIRINTARNLSNHSVLDVLGKELVYA